MDGTIFNLEGMDSYMDFFADIPPLFGDASFDLDFDFNFSDIPDSSAFLNLPVVSPGSLQPIVGVVDNVMALGTFDDPKPNFEELIQPSELQLNDTPLSLTNTKSQAPHDKSVSNKSRENSNLSIRKRPWDNSLVVFPVSGGNPVSQRQRKAYSETRKKEVARNRLIGACAQCKLRRGPVSHHLILPKMYIWFQC